MMCSNFLQNSRSVLVAATFFAVSGISAVTKENGDDLQPQFELKGGLGSDGATFLEIDRVVPLLEGSESDSALILQPGAIYSHTSDNETLYGVSIGAAHRFRTADGVAGLNAFYDRNWIEDSGKSRAHDRVSIGADYQTSNSRLDANYYYPLSDEVVWENEGYRFLEYPIDEVELYFRNDLSKGWTTTGRLVYEIDPGSRLSDAEKENGWGVLGGLSYQIDCKRIGFEVEHDTRRDETDLMFSFAYAFGANGDSSRCAKANQGGLFAHVEPSKIIATRKIVRIARIVPLTVLPDDVNSLFKTLSVGNSESDTVWLAEQGGPESNLLPDEENVLTLFPGHEDKLLVNVHQVQTLNPDLFEDLRLNSIEKVQAEMDLSIEILDRVIRHFKNQGKKVVVFSESFGSFILPRYLASRGTAAADNYVIVSGRIDMNEIVYENRLDILRDPTYSFLLSI